MSRSNPKTKSFGKEEMAAINALHFLLENLSVYEYGEKIQILRSEVTHKNENYCVVDLYVILDTQNFTVEVNLQKNEDEVNWIVVDVSMCPRETGSMWRQELEIPVADGVFENSFSTLEGELNKAREMVKQALVQFYQQNLEGIDLTIALSHKSEAKFLWPSDNEHDETMAFIAEGPSELGFIYLYVKCDAKYSSPLMMRDGHGTIVVERIKANGEYYIPKLGQHPYDLDVVWVPQKEKEKGLAAG